MRRLLLAVVLLVGCGGEGGPIGPSGSGGATVAPPPSAVVGGWGATLSSSCILLLGLKDDGSYTQGAACVEASGRNDLSEEKGTYIEDATTERIYFTITDSTCAVTTKGYYYGYSVARGKSLTIMAADALVVMTPLESWSGSGSPPSMGGVFTLGCLDKGVFTPGPLMPVP